ncbi:MAG TPA: DUF2971 domain-containing protein, partial [Candidatus Dormibacteraeota bacterium]|nr:DUF2971 domain-containing protein [Candidatus Dormibacteraeota bacterium]
MNLLKDPATFREHAMHYNQRRWGVIGILSLSATEKNLLMWAHYTSAHEGFLIEFDPSNSFFQSPNKTPALDFGMITEVTYSKIRLSVDLGEPNTAILTTKSDEWAYEGEWRIFQHVDDCDKLVKLEHDAVHLFKLPPKSLRRMVVGVRMPKNKRDAIISAVNKNPDLRHVQLEQAILDLNKFDFNYVPLPLTP